MRYRILLSTVVFLLLGYHNVEAQTYDWKAIYVESLAASHPIQILSLEKEQALTKRKQAHGAYIPKLEVQVSISV